MSFRIIPTFEQISEQITNHLYSLISNDKPKLVKMIKIVSIPPILFLVTQIFRKIWYTSYHKYKKYPPGPIGLPFFGVFFKLFNFVPFHMYLGQNYPKISMYQMGPNRWQVTVSDLDLVFKLFKTPAFATRPRNMYSHMDRIPRQFGAINGKEWKKRRNLFYNSMLRITDSKYMTSHVQNNIKSKILYPSIETAISQNNGEWYPRESCFNYAFNTVFGAGFGPDFVLPLNDPKYIEFQRLTRLYFSKLGFVFIFQLFSTRLFKWYAKRVKHQETSLEARVILNEWIKKLQSDKGKVVNHTNESSESYIKMMFDADISKSVAMSDMTSIFMVGTFTTAESVELNLQTLAKYPKVQEKIYQELRGIFNNADDITIENMTQLHKAHLLRAFIEETWRLVITNGLPRELLQDVRVDYVDENGQNDYYILPKGSSVSFNGPYFARDPKLGWKSPNKWDINNYLDKDGKFVKSTMHAKDLPKRYKFDIFGFGSRNCAGISLARKEVIFAVSILLYKYRFAGPKGDGDFEIPELLAFSKPAISPLTVIRR